MSVEPSTPQITLIMLPWEPPAERPHANIGGNVDGICCELERLDLEWETYLESYAAAVTLLTIRGYRPAHYDDSVPSDSPTYVRYLHWFQRLNFWLEMAIYLDEKSHVQKTVSFVDLWG